MTHDTVLALEDVRLDQSEGIATVVLDRPQTLNALRRQSISDLQTVLEHVSVSPSIRVLVLTGAGRGFCSGEDLGELGRTLDSTAELDGMSDHVARVQDLTRRLLALPMPVIAAVNGPAAGLGAELALNCDVRIAARSAVLGFPEVRHGLMVTNGGLYLLPRLVGHGRSLELLLSGALVDAEYAARIGLVNRVVADDELVDTVSSLARTFAANPAAPMALVKHIVQASWESSLGEVLDRETDAILRCFDAATAGDGVAAFHRQHRPPTADGSERT